MNNALLKDQKICGMQTVQAVLAKRNASVKYLAFTKEWSRELGPVCSQLAKDKRSYAMLDDAELTELAKTSEHGGVVAICAAFGLKRTSVSDLKDWQKTQEHWVVLDGIRDPHQMASIVKTAAIYGVKHIFIPNNSLECFYHPLTWRYSEGLFESLIFYRLSTIGGWCRMAEPYCLTIAGLPTGCGGRNIVWDKVPQAPGRPWALIIGGDAQQVDGKSIAHHCELTVQLPHVTKDLPLEVMAGTLLCWLSSKWH
ncbi:MAG TPA: RNA methyltransferase substrate-binding domain-containing protein [Opitutales bacterium]|nr:RNA methyltransferase substrate-binding domain-containing protein [Opitutales bacterium]